MCCHGDEVYYIVHMLLHAIGIHVVILELLEKQLQCAICLETYCDPKDLACLHVYWPASTCTGLPPRVLACLHELRVDVSKMKGGASKLKAKLTNSALPMSPPSRGGVAEKLTNPARVKTPVVLRTRKTRLAARPPNTATCDEP